MAAGSPIELAASRIAIDASLSDLPCARLNEMVVAGWVSWWFTEVGVEVSAQCAKAASGASASGAPETATPPEAARTGGDVGPVTAAVAAAAFAAVTLPAPPVPEA